MYNRLTSGAYSIMITRKIIVHEVSQAIILPKTVEFSACKNDLDITQYKIVLLITHCGSPTEMDALFTKIIYL